MMNTKYFYERDYYNLVRMEQEDDFVRLLNEDVELVTMVNQLILPLVDRLYDLVQGLSTTQSQTLLPSNDSSINQRLIAAIGTHKVMRSHRDSAVFENLFPQAFATLIARLFAKDGRNWDNHMIQSNVLSWLEDRLAGLVCSDNRFRAVKTLMRVLEQAEMLHYFYHRLSEYMPEEWISGQVTEWVQVAESSTDLERHVRTVDRDFLESYKSRTSGLDRSLSWKFVHECTRYSDQLMFDEDLAFKSSLLMDRNTKVWITLWDNLELTVLQDVPFHYTSSPSTFLEIASALVDKKDSVRTDPKILGLILLKNTFEAANELNRRLSFYNDQSRLDSLSPFERNESVISSGKLMLNDWHANKKKVYQKMITTLSAIIDVKSIESWLFSYKPRSGPVNQYTDQHNEEIKLLYQAYSEIANKPSLEIALSEAATDLNLQRFNFIISGYNSEFGELQASVALGLLKTFTLSEKFFWDNSFSPPYWETMKAIAFLLSKSSNPIQASQSMLESVKVHHEGWNVPRDNSKQITREAFFICGACMLFEYPEAFTKENEKREYFRVLTEQTLAQLRFMVSDVHDSYRSVLHLLYLIVNQIQQDQKEYYENEIAKKADDLTMVLTLLSAGDYTLVKSTKELIKIRLDRELPLERKKKRRANAGEVIDRCLEKLQIDVE